MQAFLFILVNVVVMSTLEHANQEYGFISLGNGTPVSFAMILIVAMLMGALSRSIVIRDVNHVRWTFIHAISAFYPFAWSELLPDWFSFLVPAAFLAGSILAWCFWSIVQPEEGEEVGDDEPSSDRN